MGVEESGFASASFPDFPIWVVFLSQSGLSCELLELLEFH